MKALVTKIVPIYGAKILLAAFSFFFLCGLSSASAEVSGDIKSHSPLNIEMDYGSDLNLGVNLAASSIAKVVWADDSGRVLCKKTHCRFQKKVRQLGQTKLYAVVYQRGTALYLKFNINIKKTSKSPETVLTPAHVPYLENAMGSGSAELDIADHTGRPKRAIIHRNQFTTGALQQALRSKEKTIQIAGSKRLQVYLLPKTIVKKNQISGKTVSLSLVEGSVRGVIADGGNFDILVAVDDWLIVHSSTASDFIITRGSNAVVTIKTLKGKPEIFYLPNEEAPSAGLKKMVLPVGTQVLAIRGTVPFIHADPTLDDWPREAFAPVVDTKAAAVDTKTAAVDTKTAARDKAGASVLAELHSLFGSENPVTPVALNSGKSSGRESAKTSAAQIVSRVADSLLDDSLSVRTGTFSFEQSGVIAEQGDDSAKANGTIGLSNLSVDINRHFDYGFARTLTVRYVYDTELGRLRYFAGGLGLRYYPRGGYPEGLAQLRDFDAEYRSFRPYVEGTLMLGQFLIGSAFGNVAVFSSDFAGFSISAGTHYHFTKTFALDVSGGYEQDQGIGKIEFGSRNQYLSLGLLKYH